MNDQQAENILRTIILLLILAAALCIATAFLMFAHAQRQTIKKVPAEKISEQKNPILISKKSTKKPKASSTLSVKIDIVTSTQEQGKVLGAYEEFTSDISSTSDVSASNDQEANIFSVEASTSPVSPNAGGGVSAMISSPPIPAPVISIATSTDILQLSTTTIFEQLEDASTSGISWYDDNWFELGNGFAGTLQKLTLEGKVSDPHYAASHVYLEEFKDSTYKTKIKDFTISDSAPFTPIMATTTFDGLSIPLKPYFYYRLATVQDYQNRSVLLAGTAATGTTMADFFLYGVGRREVTSTFFPYMIMEGTMPTSTLLPPPIISPKDLALSFDPLSMQLALFFSTSTDPDWPENVLHYEMNYSTSSSLDGEWTPPSTIPVSMGNTYLVGVRAEDDFGSVSKIATTTWNFPQGFVPYSLSGRFMKATQEFMLPVGGSLQSIELFGANFATGARNPDTNACNLTLLDEEGVDPQTPVQSDNGYPGYSCGAHMIFSFASSSITLLADHKYQWIYQIYSGPPPYQGSAQLYGVATNTAEGTFSDPSVVNAKFIVNGTSGILFGN